MEQLEAQYGYAADFFNSDPELRKLIQDAVSGQWTPQVFQARFMNTAWYKARNAAQRQWADLSTRDPAEAAAKLADRKRDFANRLGQFGVTLDDSSLTFAATNSLREGWDEAGTKAMMAMFANYHPGQAGGTPATLEMQMKGLANDYGVSLSDGQLTDWVNGMLAERYTQDNITDALKDMARSKYPGMSSYLDRGMTVKQVAAPYTQSYGQLLEVDPDTVDLNDNLIQQALQGQPPSDGKDPTMQSVYQFERAVRRDPRWQRTKNARDSVVSAGQNILRDWGLVG